MEILWYHLGRKTIMIKVVHNKCIGTGGRTQHLHGDDLRVDVHRKVQFSFGVMPRNGVKKKCKQQKHATIYGTYHGVRGSMIKGYKP